MDISWTSKQEALAIHNKQLALHGGPQGIRDEGLLESALARPQNYAAYASDAPSLFRLATAYAFGIAKNDAFIDGNKRTGMVVSFTFLGINGIEVTASQQDAYLTFYDLAAGKITEDELTVWFEKNSAPAAG